MAASLNSLTSTVKTFITYNAQVQPTGSVYSPIIANTALGVTISLNNGTSGSVNYADEVYSTITYLNPSANTSLDLTNLTDVTDQAALAFVRVKAIHVNNLSTAQDGTYGGSASQIQVGCGSGLTQAWAGMYNSGAVQQVYLGGAYLNANAVSGGVSVTSGSRKISLINLDAVNSGTAQVTIIGSIV